MAYKTGRWTRSLHFTTNVAGPSIQMAHQLPRPRTARHSNAADLERVVGVTAEDIVPAGWRGHLSPVRVCSPTKGFDAIFGAGSSSRQRTTSITDIASVFVDQPCGRSPARRMMTIKPCLSPCPQVAFTVALEFLLLYLGTIMRILVRASRESRLFFGSGTVTN